MSNVRAAVLALLVAPQIPLTAMNHVRTTEPAILSAIEAGAAHSPLFLALLDRLNDSDVIVHVVYDRTPHHGMAGHLTFAASAAGIRYVRISISRQLFGCDLVAIIGHELQHAAEVADAPGVRDQHSMAAFYRRIGIRRDDLFDEAFDTTKAIAAGQRIRRDLARTRRSSVTFVR